MEFLYIGCTILFYFCTSHFKTAFFRISTAGVEHPHSMASSLPQSLLLGHIACTQCADAAYCDRHIVVDVSLCLSVCLGHDNELC